MLRRPRALREAAGTRPEPHVLDDATIERTKRVNGESVEWCESGDPGGGVDRSYGVPSLSTRCERRDLPDLTPTEDAHGF